MNDSVRTPALALALGLALACGPPPTTQECIPVDESLGNPAERLWCDGLWKPQDDPDLSWNGEPAGAGLPVCLPPEADGSCMTCPVEDVLPAIEAQLTVLLAQGTGECQAEHWELGCMRTQENAEKSLGITDGSCCFEVAVWGPGCDDLD